MALAILAAVALGAVVVAPAQVSLPVAAVSLFNSNNAGL